MSIEKVLAIMGKGVPHALDAECFEVLRSLAPTMAGRASQAPVRQQELGEITDESAAEASDLTIV
jgi:hypothetical protein